MSFDLLAGLPPSSDTMAAEFNGRNAEAKKFAERLPIVRTFGPRNDNFDEHWSAYFVKFFSDLYFDPRDESPGCRECEKICPPQIPCNWVYFHGGRPDYDYGEAVFVLTSDLPESRRCDLSVTPFGLPNLVGSATGFDDETVRKACLLIQGTDWCAFLAANDWKESWREKFATYYNYQLECDTTVYLWIDPQRVKESSQPRRRTAFNGTALWPDTICDYRAWTVELRLDGGLRLDEDMDGSYTIYVREETFHTFLEAHRLPKDADQSMLKRWRDATDRALSLESAKRLIAVKHQDASGDHVAVTEAAVAITKHLTS